MLSETSLCEGLLALAEANPGRPPLSEQLRWLVDGLGASAGLFATRDGAGGLCMTLAWPETSLAVLCAALQAPDTGDVPTIRTFPLGPVAGGEAVLLLDLGDAAPSADIATGMPGLRPLLRLIVDQHMAQAAITQRAAQLADLAALWGIWQWETDAEGRLGFVSTDLTALGFAAVPNPTDAPPAAAAPDGANPGEPSWTTLSQKMRQRQPVHNVFHAVARPDGQRQWMRSSALPRRDATGAFLGYSGITTGRGAPEELEYSAISAFDRLSAILDVLPDLVFEITAEGRYTDFLAGPADLMGNARLTLPGRTLEEVLPAEIAAETRLDLDETLRSGRSQPARYRLASPLGLRWYERTGARKAAAGPNGEPTAIFVVRDVTEDVQKTEDLRRLGRVIETMSNLVSIVDVDQCITWVNRAWEQRTGWTLDDVRGSELSALVRGAQGDTENAARVTAAIARGEAYHGETQNIDRHGTRYWIDFNILPLRDTEGTVTGYVSVETDITVQKEAEARAAHLADEAERMRARLYNAIETLPDGVIIWDENDCLVVANSGYRRMYPEVAEALVEGVSQDHILNIGTALKAFPDAIGREEDWMAEERARFRNPVVDEVCRSDGRWIRRLDLRTADGGRIAVRIDTTERHRQIDALDAANRSLAEARQSLAQIIESADVGTWDWRVDTGSLRIGGRYAEMLGYTPEELGEPSDAMFRSLVHPADMARLDASEGTDFAPLPDGRERVREHQLRMRRKDGSWAWILSRSAVTERLPDGSHGVVVGIHLDVTERKRLEDEVRANRTFLIEVMDASIAAIVVMDQNGVLTYANAEAERILGLDRSTIEGRKYDDPAWHITHPDGTEMAAEDLPFRRARDRAEQVRDLRMAIEWPDGTRRMLSVNVAPHSGIEDGTDGRTDDLIITSFVDITDVLAKAVHLEQALVQAQTANKSKSTFLANMSHEIRTPLNGVLGMAELLDGLITEPRQKAMIGTIRRSGELLLNVLNEILDMSKIEAGKMMIEQISFVPAEIARQIEALHGLRAEERGLDFEVLTNTGAELPRLGDPFRIQQILNNLLSNAIKFTERGSVALTISGRPGKPLTIEVRDTGIGMTPEQVNRVFDHFEQAEDGTTRRFGGTGLGMAIVRSLISLMDGTITVTSRPGEGTEVKISLPLPDAPESRAVDAPVAEMATRVSLEGVRLLVADDSATNRLVLREMLKDTGAGIVQATNGAEVVTEWQRLVADGTPPDMLILDIAMPVLDGLGALAAIRAMDPAGAAVPAIAVTANAMSHQVTEYIMAGFDSHVPKPFRQAALLHAISTLLPRA